MLVFSQTKGKSRRIALSKSTRSNTQPAEPTSVNIGTLPETIILNRSSSGLSPRFRRRGNGTPIDTMAYIMLLQ